MPPATISNDSKEKTSKLISLLRNCINELEGKQTGSSNISSGFSPVFHLAFMALQEHIVDQMHGIQTKIHALQEEQHVEHKKVAMLRLQRQQEELQLQQRRTENQNTMTNINPQSASTDTTDTSEAPRPPKAHSQAKPPASSPKTNAPKKTVANTSPAVTTPFTTPRTNTKTTTPTASTTSTPSSRSPASASTLTPLEQQKRAAMEKRRQEVLEQRRKAAAEQKRKEQEEKRKFLEYEQRKQDLKLKAAQEAAEQKRRAQQKEQELLRKQQQQQHKKFLQQQKEHRKAQDKSSGSSQPEKRPSASPPQSQTSQGHPSSAASGESSKSWWSLPHAPKSSPSSAGRASPINLMSVPNLPTQVPFSNSAEASTTKPTPTAAAAAKAAASAPVPSHAAANLFPGTGGAAANTGTAAQQRSKLEEKNSDESVRMGGDGNEADGAEEESTHTELKRLILLNWGLQPPGYQQLKTIPELLCSIHTVYPPAFGVSAHSYFEGWSPIMTQDLCDSNSGAAPQSWDSGRLKKAVRRVRFFLHPDKLPKDLDGQQSFLCKLLWDVTNDAYEEFKKQEENGPSFIQL